MKVNELKKVNKFEKYNIKLKISDDNVDKIKKIINKDSHEFKRWNKKNNFYSNIINTKFIWFNVAFKKMKKNIDNEKNDNEINIIWVRIGSHFFGYLYTPQSYLYTLEGYLYTLLWSEKLMTYTCCTRSELIIWFQKKLVRLLSWSSAFDTCNQGSNRAIFDVDYQVWNESSLKSFQKVQILMFFEADAKKISKLKISELAYLCKRAFC